MSQLNQSHADMAERIWFPRLQREHYDLNCRVPGGGGKASVEGVSHVGDCNCAVCYYDGQREYD
jgi:hypothetical protein